MTAIPDVLAARGLAATPRAVFKVEEALAEARRLEKIIDRAEPREIATYLHRAAGLLHAARSETAHWQSLDPGFVASARLTDVLHDVNLVALSAADLCADWSDLDMRGDDDDEAHSVADAVDFFRRASAEWLVALLALRDHGLLGRAR